MEVEWKPLSSMELKRCQFLLQPKSVFPMEIPEVDVLAAKQTPDGKFIITVESRKETTKCGILRPCSAQVLPILGQETNIAIRPRQAQGLKCLHNPTTTQELSWHGQPSPHTKAYDQHLKEQLTGSTVADTSLKEKVVYDAVLGSLQRQVAGEVNWAEVQDLGAAGIDEAANIKGCKSYRVVITARQDDVASSSWPC
jgi:hypothetical protein